MATMYRTRTVLSGWQGGPGLSQTYHATGNDNNAADALIAVNRVRGGWDVVKSILPNVLTAQVSGTVDVLDADTGALVNSWSVAQPAAVTGTASGIGPAMVAAGLVWETGVIVAGKRLRGRMFICPLAGGNTDTLAPDAGVQAAVVAMGVAIQGVAPTSAQVGVWHRPGPSGSGGSFHIATAGVCPARWFSLRSRRDA